MSKFADEINAAVKRSDDNNKEMLYFSRKIANAMHLDDLQIKAAMRNDVNWDIGDYWVSPRSIHACGKWHDLLVVVPKHMESPDVGWSNKQVAEPHPDKWYYNAKGTGTTIYPYKDEQKKILKQIKEY